MGFKKVLIAIPATDYTGDTVKHIVTKANLTNQPELAEKFKVGDEIDIVKPEEETPKSPTKATTKTVKKETVKKDAASKDESVATKTSEETAAEIAEKFDVELVLENPLNGEFFTNEHLALMSVKGNKNKLKYHNF